MLQVDVSEGEDEEEIVTLSADKYKPASLDKMITLVASLVEKSRDAESRLRLSFKDYNAVAGGKVFPVHILKQTKLIYYFIGISISLSTNQRQYQFTTNKKFNTFPL